MIETQRRQLSQLEVDAESARLRRERIRVSDERHAAAVEAVAALMRRARNKNREE
jgi:hypothetical protein